MIKRYNESDYHMQLSFLVSLKSLEGDWELPWVFIIFVYLLLPGTEDIVTLNDDKSNNDSNSNIVIGNAMCFFSCQTLCFKNNFECFIWAQSKDKYERKMLKRLKRNFKRKVYINSFCLMSKVLFFFGAGRWTNSKRMKQNKSCLNMWRHIILPIRWYMTWKESLLHCHMNKEKGDE